MMSSTEAPSTGGSRLFAVLLLLLGSLGFAAAWVLLAYARNQQSSWMAILAAVDAVLLLRLARMPSGWIRAALALVATAGSIVLANWGIAATQIGKMMGLLPWQSLTKIGPDYAWTLATLANKPADLAWLAAALLLALLAGR